MELTSENTLIVYFSHAGENYGASGIEVLKTGNTQRVAKLLQKETGGTIAEIKAVREYPFQYSACTDAAKLEQLNDSRPELAMDPDPSGYDVIFLGYPNWWGTMPMPVWTWLDHHDFTDQVICPFCTNEGSGMGSSRQDLKKLAPSARIEEGLPIYGHEADSSAASLKHWIQNIQQENK
ncbi:MAG: flavodoxin [Solobacterium sp.]|jgi:flavodoxin|nr:flavodoxin [Solobacterium sp.]MCH4222222.1 flavodoxin [Solobacterium sp.]MCH4265742.1 flavodoxin [Solobacterium sp.]